MKNTFLAFLFAILSPVLHSQNFSWVIPVGGPAEDEILSVCSDNEGNVIVTGRYRNTINLNEEHSLKIFPGHYDCFIAKYDPLGKLVWGREFGGEEDDEGVFVNTDDEGNVYVIANSQSRNLKIHTTDLSGKQNNKVILIKINSNGRFEWARKIVEGNSLTQAVSVAATSAGYVGISMQYGAGTIQLDKMSFTNMGNMDIIYAMFDAKDGSLLWAQTAGQKGNDFAGKVDVDNQGNMIITGRSTGTFGDNLYIGSSSVPLHVNYTSFVCKLDKSGNILWAQRLFGQSGVHTDGISFTPSGNIYLSGYVNAGRHTFIDSVYTTTSTGNQFVLKLKSNGERLWGRTYGFSSIGRILNLTIDSRGNCLIGGYLRGSAIFDDFILESEEAGDRLFASLIDKHGNVKGAWQGGANINTTAGSVVAAGYGNTIFLSGYYRGDGIKLGRHELTGRGPTDSYIALLNPVHQYAEAKAEEISPIPEIQTEKEIAEEIKKETPPLREEKTKEAVAKTKVEAEKPEPPPVKKEETKPASPEAQPEKETAKVEKLIEKSPEEKKTEEVVEEKKKLKPEVTTVIKKDEAKPVEIAVVEEAAVKKAEEKVEIEIIAEKETVTEQLVEEKAPEKKEIAEKVVKEKVVEEKVSVEKKITKQEIAQKPQEKAKVEKVAEKPSEPVKKPEEEIKPAKVEKPSEVSKKVPPAEEKAGSLVSPNPSDGKISIKLPAGTASVVILDERGSYVFHNFTYRASDTTIEANLSSHRGNFTVVIKTRDGKEIKESIRIN